jgi:trafficking protein particle complex subunit 3
MSLNSKGLALWAKTPKANSELFALTYGALVTELIKDYETNISEINTQLEHIGHSIGVRCVDELLSKAELGGLIIPPCKNMRDTAEVIAKVGFRMFMGMTCDVGNVTDSSFSLYLFENPLSIFVELPKADEIEEGSPAVDWSQFKYSNIYCGVIRGALEQVNLKVECEFVRDILQGHDVNEIRVNLKEVIAEGAGEDYQEE